MENELLKTITINDAFFFKDTLIAGRPFVSARPRNHESLCLVTDGTLAYEKNGKTELIEKGQVAYISIGSVDKSGAYQHPSVSYFAVNFCFDTKDPHPRSLLPFSTICCKNAAHNIRELFESAVHEQKLWQPGSQMICNGILQQILGMLYNYFSANRSNSKRVQTLEDAFEYLTLNYHRPDLKVADLAKISRLSEKHFRRLFVELYQTTPHKFVRDFRLNKAKILLMDHSKQISDIALECGFSDVYAFSHCFKAAFGMSPKAYKEQMK